MRSAGLIVLIGLLLAPTSGAAVKARHYLPVAMQFSDATHGFVELQSTTACRSCMSRVQRTNDGGETWRATSLTHLPPTAAERRFRAVWRSGTKQGLQLASVVGGSVAWGVRQMQYGGSQLFVTRDGGHVWHKVPVPCGRPYAFWSPLVTAVSARRAWLLCLGQPGAGQQNRALYETRDGKRWMLRSNLSGSGYGQGLRFSSSGFGLLAESRGGLLVSRDGGRSWQFAMTITSPETAEPEAIAVVKRNQGLVLVRNDRSRRVMELWRTGDAGRRWQLLHRWR